MESIYSSVLDKPPVRYSLATVFFIAFVICAYFAVDAITIRHRMEQDVEKYYNAPGCYTNAPGGATAVDESLPPCVNVQEEVTGKLIEYKRRSGSELNYVELHDSSGAAWIVGPWTTEAWDRVQLGDTVSAQVWRGVIYKVSDTSAPSIGDQTISDDQSGSFVCQNERFWVYIAAGCFIVFCRLLTARHVLEF